MAHESFPQLKLVFEEYKNVSGRTIEQALEAELSGELLDAMLAIGKCFKLTNIILLIKNMLTPQDEDPCSAARHVTFKSLPVGQWG